MAIGGVRAWVQARATMERGQGSDPFGYLAGAQQVRAAAAARRLPGFVFESAHGRLLIERMKAWGLAQDRWDELVAPPAAHFMPKADHVGLQYPPGTALALAPFPQGLAVRRVSQLAIATLSAMAAAGLVAAWRASSSAAAAVVVLAALFGLSVLNQIGDSSYSINVIVAPMFLASVAAGWGGVLSALGRARAAWAAALFAGACAGFCVLTRIAAAIVLPGLALCFLIRNLDWRRAPRSPLAAWAVGAALFGALPLAAYNARVAGSWREWTYSRYDCHATSLRAVGPNFRLYFGGTGFCDQNVVLGCAALGTAAAVLGVDGAARRRAAWARPAAAAGVVVAASAAFFLTHGITMHYYLVPSGLAAAALLAVAAIAGTRRGAPSTPGTPGTPGEPSTPGTPGGPGTRRRRRAAWLAAAMAAAPAAAIAGHVRDDVRALRTPPPAWDASADRALIPADLEDPRAWVWGEGSVGTLWYYNRKPAFKISYTDPAVRLKLYQFVYDRGEGQFLINDDAAFSERTAEILRWGGKLENRGTYAGYPYYRIDWRQRPDPARRPAPAP